MKNYVKGKYCIYLDQFAVSNLSEGLSCWNNIHALLQEGYAQGKLFCPLSGEHLLESAAKQQENAIRTHAFLLGLSDNLCVKQEVFITSQLLISAVRKNNITYRTFLDNVNPAYNYQYALQNLISRRDDFTQMIGEATSFSNEIRVIGRKKHIPRAMQSQLLQASIAIVVSGFRERLKELIDKKGITIRGISFSSREVPHWTDYTLDALLKKHKMTEKEATRLYDYLGKQGFDGVSTLDVRYTLQGYSAVKQKKDTVNDQIDIMRIATAVQIADLIITDKARKHELHDTGLASKYSTQVLSGTATDLHTIEQHLQKLIDNSQ